MEIILFLLGLQKLKIKLVGGMSGEQHLRRALTSLLTNDLAYQLTWMAPQHSSRKRGPCTETVYFGALKMCNILIGMDSLAFCLFTQIARQVSQA